MGKKKASPQQQADAMRIVEKAVTSGNKKDVLVLLSKIAGDDPDVIKRAAQKK